MISIQLEELTQKKDNIVIQYKDIVNYEIARENICNYIFLLSRRAKCSSENEGDKINEKINTLIYIRDNLQIEDLKNVSLVLSVLIPEYKREASTLAVV